MLHGLASYQPSRSTPSKVEARPIAGRGMVVQASLRMRHRGCVSESFRGETVMMQVSGERGSDVWVLRAPTPALLDAAIARCEAYVQNKAAYLDRSPTSAVFRGINSPAGTIATIRATPCSILWPVVYRDGLEHYTILAPDRGALAEVVDRLGKLGDVVVERVAEVPMAALEVGGSLADLATGLTARQLEALRAAARSGYYQVPRPVDAADIARQLHVSRATFQEHLRKAERQVLEGFVAAVERHPGLQEAAAVRPGRKRGLKRRRRG